MGVVSSRAEAGKVRICKGKDLGGAGGLGSYRDEEVKNGMKWEKYRIWTSWSWVLVFPPPTLV